MNMDSSSKITRTAVKRWDTTTIASGFIEIENVQDGTVSLTVADENVDELQRTWLDPTKARRVADALLQAAHEIETESARV